MICLILMTYYNDSLIIYHHHPFFVPASVTSLLLVLLLGALRFLPRPGAALGSLGLVDGRQKRTLPGRGQGGAAIPLPGPWRFSENPAVDKGILDPVKTGGIIHYPPYFFGDYHIHLLVEIHRISSVRCRMKANHRLFFLRTCLIKKLDGWMDGWMMMMIWCTPNTFRLYLDLRDRWSTVVMLHYSWSMHSWLNYRYTYKPIIRWMGASPVYP